MSALQVAAATANRQVVGRARLWLAKRPCQVLVHGPEHAVRLHQLTGFGEADPTAGAGQADMPGRKTRIFGTLRQPPSGR